MGTSRPNQSSASAPAARKLTLHHTLDTSTHCPSRRCQRPLSSSTSCRCQCRLMADSRTRPACQERTKSSRADRRSLRSSRMKASTNIVIACRSACARRHRFVVFARRLVRRLIARWPVVPRLVRRHLMARKALRLLPLDAAARAHAARPERVPHGAAAGHAGPAVFGAGPPAALGAVDFGLFHPGQLRRAVRARPRRQRSVQCLGTLRASRHASQDRHEARHLHPCRTPPGRAHRC